MNIFKINAKEDFIEQLVLFIDARFSSNFTKLKILLPSGLACSYLKTALIKKYQAIILPNIIPLTELKTSEEIIFSPNRLGKALAISSLEEKLILTKIINSSQKLNYNLTQSLKLSSSLANLFFELEANIINIKDLKTLPKLEQSKHWEMICDFLTTAQEDWQKAIGKIDKNNLCLSRKLSFQSQINYLRDHPEEKLLIAGLTYSDQITYNFIQAILTLENGYYILPPFPPYSPQQEELKADSPLYHIGRTLQLLDNVKPIELDYKKANILDKLLIKSTDMTYNNYIEYAQLENNLLEAEYIALRCKDYLTQNNLVENVRHQIAIIIHSDEFKDQLILFLKKYKVIYEDFLGIDLLNNQLISLLQLITKITCLDFDLQRFFELFSHPELQTHPKHQNHLEKLKNIIRRKCPLAPTIESVTKIISFYGEPELQNYYGELIKILSTPLATSLIFHELLEHNLKILEKLIPDVWNQYQNITPTLSDIFTQKWDIVLPQQKDFPDILTELFTGNKLLSTNSKSNVILCQAKDLSLLNYKFVIISELNEDTYPKSIITNPWLNLQMQKELKLDSKISEFGHYLYEFYLNLHNEHVLLTRAKKTIDGQTIVSPFLLHLKHILKDKLICRTVQLRKQSSDKKIINSAKSTLAVSQIFPEEVFASDIETLIRCPYNFYAKKILKLRKIKEVKDQPELSDFGNFFHKIAEIYSNNYLQQTIEAISSQLLDEIELADYYKKSWQIKIAALAAEFTRFETKRRINNSATYCELKGSIKLQIGEQQITLSAIADRIELDKEGNVTIIDYKTGSIPTKKEISAGLAPQMLVEAMILAENGFKHELYQLGKNITLTYVKIGSQTPYLQIMEIDLNMKEIKKHKEGLINLLEYYLLTGQYPIIPCHSKYDDYQHLARRYQYAEGALIKE